MASWQEEPSPGRTVWHPEYKNGIIRYVDYDNGRLVYCDFYLNGEQTIEWDMFIGSFDEGLNQFVLQEI